MIKVIVFALLLINLAHVPGCQGLPSGDPLSTTQNLGACGVVGGDNEAFDGPLIFDNGMRTKTRLFLTQSRQFLSNCPDVSLGFRPRMQTLRDVTVNDVNIAGEAELVKEHFGSLASTMYRTAFGIAYLIRLKYTPRSNLDTISSLTMYQRWLQKQNKIFSHDSKFYSCKKYITDASKATGHFLRIYTILYLYSKFLNLLERHRDVHENPEQWQRATASANLCFNNFKVEYSGFVKFYKLASSSSCHEYIMQICKLNAKPTAILAPNECTRGSKFAKTYLSYIHLISNKAIAALGNIIERERLFVPV